MVDAVKWDWYYGGLHAASVRSDDEGGGTRWRLERARTVMHENFADPLDLERLARKASLSRFHFSREFRQQFQTTPHQYLTQRRVEHAKELLWRTQLSVTEVCMAVGFSSLGSFCTMFTRHVGHSPTRYRRVVVQCLGTPAVTPAIPSCFLRLFCVATATFEKHVG